MFLQKGIIRLLIIFALLLVGFGIALKQMYVVQIVRHDELLQKAKKQYTTEQIVHYQRGCIYTYDGQLLAGNRHTMTIAYDAAIRKDDDNERIRIAMYLADNLPDMSFAEIYGKLCSGKKAAYNAEKGQWEPYYSRYVVIARNVDWEIALKLRKGQSGVGINSLIFEETTARVYPRGILLSNVLGFSVRNGNLEVPASGLESYLDSITGSKDGKREWERTKGGSSIGYGHEAVISEGNDGSDIFLTIREPLKGIMEEELDKMYARYNPKAIYAVMVDPQNGDVLALAQRPTFNPNDRSTMTDGSLYGVRVASDIYEPGSVMKPFVVAMALDQKTVTPDTKIETTYGSGEAWYYGRYSMTDSHPVGTATPAQILQNSSNVGTAKIALMMGRKRVYDTLRTFCFGEKTGLPIRTEHKGVVNSKLSDLDSTRFCIGYGISVTALQLARAYCMLANGGYKVDLRLVDRVRDSEGKLTYAPVNVSDKSVFQDPGTSPLITSALESVTKPGGTARGAAIPGFRVAGKTGTAKKIVNGKYSNDLVVVTFCGYVPAGNPEFVLVIVCDEPEGDRRELFGGSVAGPYFANIARRSLEYLGVPPDMSVEEWEADRALAQKQNRLEKQNIEKERKERLRRGKKN